MKDKALSSLTTFLDGESAPSDVLRFGTSGAEGTDNSRGHCLLRYEIPTRDLRSPNGVTGNSQGRKPRVIEQV